jgi:LPXTG-motif cell wall-anchored protein
VLAQVQTETQTEAGRPLQAVSVERGEVVYVSGRNLMVKMEDGTLRSFMNVPEDVTATVDGKQLTIRDLKPGMKLQRTITTTVTPALITKVQSVSGTVFSVSPPKSVVLTLEDGTHQKFDIPEGQQFDVRGKTVDAFGLRKGMQIQATKIVQVPATTVAEQRSVTGTMPPPPPPDKPVLIAQAEPMPPPPPPPAATPAKLPETASPLPWIGLAGIVSLGLGLLLAILRRKEESAR